MRAPTRWPFPTRCGRRPFRSAWTTEKLADGVYLLGGASHNSVAVEFKDFVAVVEAPLDEARNLAVIEEVVRLIPNKPIRFLVNTHQHHDHIGGLRTYMHIGATIITHWKNFDFYTRDVLNYAPRTLQPDMVSLWPPTELAEGYHYEQVTENYVLSDGTRNMNMYYVQPLAARRGHADGVSAGGEDGDRSGPARHPRAAPGRSHAGRTGAFYNEVRQLKLDVSRIVPIHGKPVPWSDFLKVMGPEAKTN